MAAETRKGRGKPAKNGIHAGIGARIKALRHQRGLSQGGLGKLVGVSQQQVGKYETGQDRVPTEMLRLIASALGTSSSAIYEALDSLPLEPAGFSENESPPFELEAFATRELTQLVRAFQAIEDKTLRKRVLDLVRSMAESGKKPARP